MAATNSRKIRVAFDASCLLAKNKSGVEYYTEGLILHLAQDYPEQIELIGHYCNFLGRRKNLGLPQAPNISYRPTKLISSRMLNLLRRLRLPIPFELLIKGRADFHLFPAFIGFGSLFKTPSAPVIHDLTYLKFPEFVSQRLLQDLTRLVPATIKRAKFIITISDTSATAIRQHYNSNSKDIVVTHIPPFHIQKLSSKSAAESIEKLGIKQDFILFLGNLEPRKNLTVLLAAYEGLYPKLQQEFGLVLAGGKGWHDEEIHSEIERLQAAGHNIILPGYVNDQQRAALLQQATALVLPSAYEGFGMPLLEAMSYQTPVIASDIPIFHEVCDQAALYFNPSSSDELAKQIQRLLSNQKLQQELVVKGTANLKRFSWQEVTSTIYRELERNS